MDDPRSTATIRAALQAERARLLGEVAETITAPGQMTYGSQAAAASQVFEQQRDLALRDRASQHLELVDAALARLDAGTYGPACAAASRSRPTGSRPCRGPPTTSTASGWSTGAAVDDAADGERRAAGRPGRDPGRGRTPARDRPPDAARRRSGRPATGTFLKAESLQPIGAFKLRGAYVAVAVAAARRSSPAASSPTRRATTPRASPGPPGCSARRAWSSCRRTRRRSSASGSPRTAPRSSSSGPSSDERAAAWPSRSPRERGLAIIPPFDDDRIIAGQGTVGLEIVEDLPDVASSSSRSAAAGWPAGSRPRSRRSGRPSGSSASSRSSPPTRASRWPVARSSAGRRRTCRRTCADGTRTQALGRRTFLHLRAHLDGDRHRVARRRSSPASGSRRSGAGWWSSRRAP